MYAFLTNIDFIRQLVTDATDRCRKFEGKAHLRPRSLGGSLEPDVTQALADALEYVMRHEYKIPQNIVVTPEYRWRGDEHKFFDDVMDYAREIKAANRNIQPDGTLRIRPDIIVHEYGPAGPNYFVLELKMSTNKSRAQTEFDHLKLQLMTAGGRGYEYHLGIELRAHRAFFEDDRRIEIVSQWQNGTRLPP